MSDWLTPLRVALDAAAAPIAFFFRDDDAGWDDTRLRRLLDLFAQRAIALDLAVIPDALGPALALELGTRIADAPLHVHQHGFRHVNHEPDGGRKCEFGPSRALAQQWTDLILGQRRLTELFGGSSDAAFTPPWNRCTQATVDCLAALNCRVLSRDATAPALDLHGMREIRISIDWTRRKHETCDRHAALGSRIAAATLGTVPVGIMLHHAAMDDDDLSYLRELLALLGDHDAVRCGSMLELAREATGDAP